ncbi:Transmembrane 9 superfamily member 7 [Porphyridium purpureum]|uniref:Transmembrane 9 superfamily member n=1 Tax=Porphyridium purpureum TaxID=35688 RepID=A0A5J4YP96_PORPP|nr:Transmembrane 9 superfamily member 7 [Porphyridium purpureum]|eukprot:POR0241..scf295_9
MMNVVLFVAATALLCICTPRVAAFYLPGTSPVDYEAGAQLDVFGRKLYSIKSDVPHDFYFMPHCLPPEGEKKKHSSLGSLLEGERDERTAYSFSALQDEECHLVCRRPVLKREAQQLRKLAKDEYFVRMSLDNMPLTLKVPMDDGSFEYVLGYPLFTFSADKPDEFHYNNHLSFTVLYHRPKLSPSDFSRLGGEGDFMRVVGFEVHARSIKHVFDSEGNLTTCGDNGKPAGPVTVSPKQAPDEIVYTFDVEFVESSTSWATRWDHLLKVGSASRRIEWFSIINSCLIVFFLSLLVGLVLLRTVWRDFARYNNLDDQEELREESGWKLIHGDVFRTPFFPEGLAFFVGVGTQIFTVSLATILFALIGFFSPANRGSLLTGGLIFMALSSAIAGYSGASLYETLEGTRKRTVTSLIAFGFSGLAFSIFFLMNVLAVFLHSTDAVPFFTLLLLVALWLLVSVPLTYIGAFFGYKAAKVEFPCRVNTVPREIRKYSDIPPFVFCLLSGVLPFGVIFIQLVFILNSLWSGQLFYMFGFMAVVLILLIVTSCETSLVVTYLTMVNEDYHWWWKSFFSTGSIGLYVFLYSIVYLFTQPLMREMHFVSIIMYFSYMLLMSIGCGITVGMIGFRASFAFVKLCFSSIHVD